jgi:hypothetical protein
VPGPDVVRTKPLAIVLDRKHQPIAIARDPDTDPGGVRVLLDVVEGFLHDPKQVDCDDSGKAGSSGIELEIDDIPGTVDEPIKPPRQLVWK